MPIFHFNPYALPPFLASIFIITLGIFVLYKNPKSPANSSWFLGCLSLFIWLIGDTLLYSVNNEELGIFFTRFIYIGVTAIPITFLYFSFNITKTKINPIFLIFLVVAYFLTVLIEFKTELISAQVYKYYWGFYPKAGEYHGVYLMFWASTYIYALKIIQKGIIASKSQDDKNRLFYAFLALFIGGVVGPIDFMQKYGFEFYPFGYFCIPIIIGFITYAMMKHDLMDIRIVIKKGLTYSLLVAAITGIYLLLIMIIERSFKGMIGYHSTIISLISAFIIAILFNPLRNKIQTIIDRLFLGKTPSEFANENQLLKQELEHSERLKIASTLALGLAHEVKNPLTTLKTFTEFLPQHYDDKEFLQKFSKIVPREIERVNDIIKQLLQFSKPNPPRFQEVSLYKLIQDILIFFNSEFLKHKIKLNESHEDRDIKINGDPDQIKQTMLNILLNAIDAMPRGGTINIQTRPTKDGFVEIEISDTGCGIAKEDLKHIFDPFYSKKEFGTGLGLSVTYQIIKNHSGKIDVASELNKGTTFKIKLPNLSPLCQ